MSATSSAEDQLGLPPPPPVLPPPGLGVRIRPWYDMADEVRGRLPFYSSDWSDGFSDKKVLAAGIFIFLANVAPAVTFAFFLDSETKGSIGVVEVLLSSAISGTIYAVLSGQPLIIVGVTGPVSVFVSTLYNLAGQLDIAFLPFLGWTTLWAALMHIVIAASGLCGFVTYVTRFSCEIFGALIAVVYVWNGVAELVDSFRTGFAVGLLATLLAILTLTLALVLANARAWRFWPRGVRAFIADYAIAGSVCIATVVSAVVIPRFQGSGDVVDHLATLNVPYRQPFLTTTSGRAWLVDFTDCPVWAVFASIISGFVLCILFYFDHNVSSLLSQRPESNLQKPAAFNWDFFVLGLTLVPCAFLGIPPCNGLIPQAPLHVSALSKRNKHGVVVRVAEQRISGLLQALFTFAILAPPLLRVVSHVPRAVLAGLFLAMAVHSLESNQFAARAFALACSDPIGREAVLGSPQLSEVPKNACTRFTLVQVAILAVTVAITESHSPVALLFPVVICALVPIRYFFLPRLIPSRWLDSLDCETIDAVGDEEESQQNASSSPLLHAALDVGPPPSVANSIPLTLVADGEDVEGRIEQT
ncbi:hypothetical protein HDU89_001818 [Geranomyces variabilis]|nr:hypothetical protein HDU89_001818 [Geranomyces variabilis]